MNRVFSAIPGEAVTGTAFPSAADAWFWTMSALQARGTNVHGSGASIPRPCDPDDVICCLERLYSTRRIDARHARVLRSWGERQRAPDPGAKTAQDARLWQEALLRLEGLLRDKGIVSLPKQNSVKGK